MTGTDPATTITGLEAVADRYDAVFVDQFGVLHDGVAPYPDAVVTLQRLAQGGARVIVLSNSGKRSAPNAARLERLGFPRASWTDFLSSGEVAWSILAKHDAGGSAPRRCLLLARDDDRSAIAGLRIETTDDGAACDLVLIAGSRGDVMSLDHYAAILAPAVARGVPAYCTNPDKAMLTPGGLRFGAGRVAELYEALGGTVTWIGKPFPAIYSAARRMVADITADRILCIGDSVEHDIAGARNAGLSSCLVTSGVHADADDAGLAALYSEAGATPDFVMPTFRW